MVTRVIAMILSTVAPARPAVSSRLPRWARRRFASMAQTSSCPATTSRRVAVSPPKHPPRRHRFGPSQTLINPPDSGPHLSDLFNGPGAEAATGAVVFGLALGITSLVVGLKRRQRRPRWNDRSDYRSA